MANIKDHTALIPFILFVLFGGIIVYAIIKGQPKKLSQAELDAIYAKNE